MFSCERIPVPLNPWKLSLSADFHTNSDNEVVFTTTRKGRENLHIFNKQLLSSLFI
jgi:hypothetical protein